MPVTFACTFRLSFFLLAFYLFLSFNAAGMAFSSTAGRLARYTALLDSLHPRRVSAVALFTVRALQASVHWNLRLCLRGWDRWCAPYSDGRTDIADVHDVSILTASRICYETAYTYAP
jgi:hypothetical protein